MEPVRNGSPVDSTGSQSAKTSFGDVTRVIHDNIGASARLLQAAQSLHAEAAAERERAEQELARLRAERADFIEQVRSFHETLGLLLERLEADGSASMVMAAGAPALETETDVENAVESAPESDFSEAPEREAAQAPSSDPVVAGAKAVAAAVHDAAPTDADEHDQPTSPIPLTILRAADESGADAPYILTIRGPRTMQDVLALDEILERQIGAERVQPLEFVPGAYRVAVTIEDAQLFLEELVSHSRLPLRIMTVEPGRMDAVMAAESVSA